MIKIQYDLFKRLTVQKDKQDSGQQNHICQPESFFKSFHNIVAISVPSVKVKTIRSSLYTVT